ncbi:MAG TPA: extracellular solute-binding protein [Candidatus Binatia bacterium]|nr:extracellular solute-binding protein [Candidatus Binatia bacterium]
MANSPASRRNFIKAVGGSALATGIGANIIVPGRARAARKTLKILQWVHFVPAYDAWFNSERIKDWGEKNDTDVIVDNIHTAGIPSRARAEVSAQRGHDLFLFNWPPPAYEDQVVDMSDVYQECERRVGKPIDLAIKSTYNPKTKKYFAFSPSFTPDPVNWRQDLFSQVGLSKGPTTWDEVRSFGSKIRQQSGTPVGIGLAQEEDTSMALRTIMYSWGAHEQDEAGNPVLNSKQTVDAIKFVKSLFEETMTPDVFTWDTSSNNRWMLAGKCSLAVNAISITREAENKGMTDISRKIQLARALKGPVRAIGLEHVMSCYVVWKFAENIAGAKQFLVDYTTDFKPAFLASQFYNFPCFPKTVPDLRQIIAYDDRAQPADKYKVLEDVLSWATNVGYPGHANAAIDEIFSTWLLNLMFAKAAGGALSPEEALKEADTACKRIFAKWKDRGLI